jgi:hypothetical protein
LKVNNDAVSFVASHNPSALDALATSMAKDEKSLLSSVPSAPSHQLKVVTLAFVKAVGIVAADVLLLTEPNLVPTLTMANTAMKVMNQAITVGNRLVADAQSWRASNG